MPIVEVRDLSKTFWVKRKAAGLRGSFQSIIRPEFRRVEAVKGVTSIWSRANCWLSSAPTARPSSARFRSMWCAAST
ncbi:MAG TPA: hypothetical protein VJG32_05385 [Anaerolineae bacterium]|nr:hypothetical protein [Anaerolineae bacterium]